MIPRLYLLTTAFLYAGLAIWCSVAPAATSKKVGFELKGGSGESEFMTVYGGLEFGIALIFALAALKDSTINYGVMACILIHASLVVFRTLSFFVYKDIGPFTYRLAVGEWVIAILGILVYLFARVEE